MNTVSRSTYPLAVIAFFLSTFNACAVEPILVGVLEEPQCARTRGAKARIMFQRTANGWTSLDFPESTPSITKQTWSIAFDGRQPGTVRLIEPPEKTGESGKAPLKDKLFGTKGHIPVHANLNAFSGWCDTPTTRPLVLVSQPFTSDPAGWKPFSVPAEYKLQLFDQFKKSLGTRIPSRCNDQEGAKEEAFHFDTGDLSIFKGYQSKSEGTLVSIGLNPEKSGCDGPPDSAWSNRWFYIRDKRINLIGIGLELVDSGDYDGDGLSELLFWKTAYNQNGYALVFDNLRKTTEYVWNYH